MDIEKKLSAKNKMKQMKKSLKQVRLILDEKNLQRKKIKR